MKLGLIWFTACGEKLAAQLKELQDLEFVIFNEEVEPVRSFVAKNFETLDGLIFIGAVGIALRMVAPHLVSKDQDPAVVVLDEGGRFSIPILSGHLGGANALAQRLAEKLGAIPVITTSTDVHSKFAVDLWSQSMACVIGDIRKIKYISSAILADQEVGLASDFEVCGELPPLIKWNEDHPQGICVSLNETRQPFKMTLHLIPRIIVLGVGCRRGTASEALESFLLGMLKQHDISLKSVAGIHSIDLKKDEGCLIAFSEKYGLPFNTYSEETLNAIPGIYTGSEFVRRTTGVDNVCERSAMVGIQGSLIVRKQTFEGITAAIACKDWRCEF